MKLLVRPNCSD